MLNTFFKIKKKINDEKILLPPQSEIFTKTFFLLPYTIAEKETLENVAFYTLCLMLASFFSSFSFAGFPKRRGEFSPFKMFNLNF